MKTLKRTLLKNKKQKILVVFYRNKSFELKIRVHFLMNNTQEFCKVNSIKEGLNELSKILKEFKLEGYIS